MQAKVSLIMQAGREVPEGFGSLEQPREQDFRTNEAVSTNTLSNEALLQSWKEGVLPPWSLCLDIIQGPQEK